ncbi:MAG: hypothetical protein JNM71_00795 [Flavobacterium lindanitolerans]|jgi:hypothetical protein|nr:hypothetical protein [Flavobacterium lindanitolerans]PZQ83560.1 MAG: hypothetical protein DI548_10680 [Flavobacterium johnsoniae]
MLILLDIDGVMVPANSWRKPEFLDDGFPVFSNGATKALQKLISETSANILLTTSHKSKYSINKWREIFLLRGIDVQSIDVLPENTLGLNRREEIMKWIDIQKVHSHYIIIDDDKSLNALPGFVKANLLQTSGSIGLTEYQVEEVLEKISDMA